MFFAHGWGSTPDQPTRVAEAMRQRGIEMNFFGLDLTATARNKLDNKELFGNISNPSSHRIRMAR